MDSIVLHEEAFEELRSAFIESGALPDDEEMHNATMFAVSDLTFKLYEYIPTAEEIARRDAFMATPFGRIMSEMFTRSNKYIADLNKDFVLDRSFISGQDWPVGSNLRIRLPKDYKVSAD